MAADGAHVAVCARNAIEVAQTVEAFAAHGVTVTGRVVDVADGPAFVDDAAAGLSGIDTVVTNVRALAIANDEAGWQRGFEVDMKGTVRLVNAAMPHPERSGHGSIVTSSSVSGREIDFAAGPYGAFKAAIIRYTQSLACHPAGKPIRANSVSPGNTCFPGDVWNQIETGNPALFSQALGLKPTGRMGAPQEMANAVVFLASPAASFITGTHFVVDGAMTRGVQF